MSRLRPSCGFVFSAFALLLACQAQPMTQQDSGIVLDLGPEPDLSASRDLSHDQGMTRDLTQGGDLQHPADLSYDLSSPVDLGPPDMSCRADTQNDPNNCGSCGHVCPAGNNCCAGRCSNPQTDNLNCMSCGHSCGENGCCGGLCTSLTTAKNCGACGVTCNKGQSCCGDGCTDEQTDPNNCGYCGNVCPKGYFCSKGSCMNPDAGTPPDLSAGCLGGKAPPAVCFIDADPMSGARYTICRADCDSAWVAHADPGGGTFAFQTICKLLGYSMADMWGGTCGDICGYCMGMVSSCMMPGKENYDNAGMCGSDCLGNTVMWHCVR